MSAPEGTGPHQGGVHPAVARARRVVGLYGDPSVAWSVVLRLRLALPLDPAAAGTMIERLHGTYDHLGPPPELQRYPLEQRQKMVSWAADEMYGDAGPLVRVALDDSRRELVVAVHHGCADGLGMLGYAGALTGLDLSTSARGVAVSAEPTSFVRGSVRRLGEAVLRPPVRVTSSGRTGESGDRLLTRDHARFETSTPALLVAAARAVRSWNGAHAQKQRPMVVALGLSRRPGMPPPPPDRDTAFARLDTSTLTSVSDARTVVAETRPEPAFPVTRAGGVGPLVTRLLAPRLGSTLLISNLGLLARPGVERLEFWPVPSGPAGVCLGLASTPSRTTLTSRFRRGWFSEDEASSFADLVTGELRALARDPAQ